MKDTTTGSCGDATAQPTAEERRAAVRERYSRAATTGDGCCAPACCGGENDASGGQPPAREVSLGVGYTPEDLEVVPEDANLGLGCGNPTRFATLREGDVVLDLGSGAGIDCFLAAQRVGPTGQVIGVDMTPEMVERARANARRGGYTNVEFRLGEIEALPVADESVDVIISNCVLNLSADKARVLREAHRVLRKGGRLIVSDLVSTLPVPAVLEGNLDAVAGCLPTQREAYLETFRSAGFTDVRIAEEHPYPADYLLSDAGVQAFLEAHPDEAAELTAFAGSIFGAHFEATKG